MDPILLAKTEPRKHANGAEGTWWAEYRVREQGETERWADGRKGLPFVLEQRYSHERDSEHCNGVHRGTWEAWDYGQTVEQAVMSCAGDSHYTEATSLHSLHEAMVVRVKADRARDARIMEIRAKTHFEYRISSYLAPEYREVNVVADERERAQAEYERELKAARLYSKASAGTAPQDKVDAIKASVRERYKVRLAERQAEHARLMAELASLESERS